MALQLYTLFTCYFNGSLLAEEGQVSVDVDSKAQEVNTVAKGFAGLSPGAAKVTIQIDSAIPAAGFELNPGRFVRTLQPGEMTIFGANVQLTVKGFITKYSVSHSVNNESKLSLTFEAEPGDFS